MTIEVITFPAGIYPTNQRLTPDVGPGQQFSESAFIGAQSVVTYRGAERWKLDLQFDDLTGADRADMMAFVTRLRVSHNVFLVINHTAPQRGNLNGGAVNSGTAGQYLILKDLAGNVSSWARTGDFIAVNSMLKMVLQDAGSNGPGVASLQVWPPFYGTAPVWGAPVFTTITSAFGGFRMVGASVINTDPPGYRTSLTISAVERINSAMVADFL